MTTHSRTVADFLLDRLEQLGVRSIFGVPGDFSLVLLDYIEDRPGMQWVGTASELVAGYAADGYARASESLGVVCTTFGVGEASLLNACAGSYAENIPVLHIVGMPSTKLQKNKTPLYHTYADGRFDNYRNMASFCTVEQLVLEAQTIQDAASQIDALLRVAITRSRPVYLGVPTDLVEETLYAAESLQPITKTRIMSEGFGQPLKESLLDHILNNVQRMWQAAKRPCILFDTGAVKAGAGPLVQELAEATGMTWFSTPMSKAVELSEMHSLYSGCYYGAASREAVKEHFESADLIFSFGPLVSDTNTGGFSTIIPEEKTIEFHADHINLSFATYPCTSFQTLIPLLIDVLKSTPPAGLLEPLGDAGFAPFALDSTASKLQQDTFWPQVARFLRVNDISIADTGTASYGILDARLKSTHQAQILYGSIGWATGAALGCAAAGAETGKRCVLFTGEGAAQVTFQDVGLFMKHGLKPVIFLLNNRGYTIERAIHGATRSYNDVVQWDWQRILECLGPRGASESYRVSTPNQLEALIQSPWIQDSNKVQLIEVMLEPEDCPRPLRILAERVAKANAT